MSVFQCPHCSTGLVNDGSLVGQVVTCQSCGGLFTMPPLPPRPTRQPPPPPPQSPARQDPFAFNETDDPPVIARRRPGKKRGVTIGGIILAVLIIGPVVFFTLGGRSLSRPKMADVRSAIWKLNQNEPGEGAIKVNKAELLRQVGKPSRVSHVAGEDFWTWDCKDGQVVARLSDWGDNLMIWEIDLHGR